MRGRRPADDAGWNRQFNRADQIAVGVTIPGGQRAVLPAARRVGVRGGFRAAPIVRGRHHDRVDAIHDPFVVRRRAVRIDLREYLGFDDVANDLIAQSFALDAAACAREPFVGKVRQDSQHDAPAGQLLDQRRDDLARAIDRVRAHRIEDVEKQVDDEHRTDTRFGEQSYFQARCAAAVLDER